MRQLYQSIFFKRVLCIAGCLVLLLSGHPSKASAAKQPLKTVRVGFFAFEGYHIVDEAGTRSGYGYELLQHMAGYTDWQFEYVGYDKSWNDIQDMLEIGEIDLLTSAQKTPEREAAFDFSDESVGTSSAILTVKAGNERYLQQDYANWSGMRVGMMAGNSRNAAFDSYARQHGFTYTPAYFLTADDMMAALQRGDGIDAAVSSNLRRIENEWILAQFDPSPFYIMVKKGNQDLLSDVNVALEKLYSAEPNLPAQLMSKYYGMTGGNELALTVEERAFIDSHRDTVFTALLKPDETPYSFLKNGAYGGALFELAEDIIALSGLNIQFAMTDTREKYEARIASGDYDLCFDACVNFALSERYGYRLSAPYLSEPAAMLHKRDRNTFDSIALVSGSDIALGYGDRLASLGKTVTYYDTTDAAIDAVQSGKQDMTLLVNGVAHYRERAEATNSLVAENLSGYTTEYAVAVNASAGPTFYSILNKAVENLNESRVDEVRQAYAAYDDGGFSMLAYMYDYPMHVVLTVVALFLITGLVMLWVYTLRAHKREAAKRAEEERRGELLSAALAAAEKAGNAKSQFLSRVSHEMRTPLNAILGLLSLSKSADAKQMRQYLNNAEIAAKQLLSVINDVLDMSSIESGKMKIAHVPFDLRELVHTVTNLFLMQCRQKGVAYETRMLTPVDEWLVGDSMRVSQILINLLGNAVKFTEQGHIHLSIRQLDAKGPQAFIRFEVTDTGCGMSPEMQSRLFQPFEQESATTAQKYGGSGLGLSIVKNLVSMMDGAIRVESRQGVGTTFTVDLPFGRAGTPELRTLPAGQTLHVLVVDDSQLELDYVSAILNRMHVRHACVGNGEAALVELKRATDEGDAYNICLIDWRMPQINGLETTQRIRSQYGKDVIVIVVSAYDHNQVDEAARKAGANLFVSKPLFQSALFDLFMSFSGGRIAEDEPKKELATLKSSFPDKRILLAEDNAMNRMVAEGMIEKFGIACDTVVDGQTALDRFLASTPGYYDAILMDIQMPKLNGFEATRLLRASDHPDAKTVQIIALTANAFSEDITKSLSGGMNAHVAKPIEPALLLEALNKAFSQKER